MSLSRRLTLSLLVILLIFSLNVATHFWGSFARTESMSAYRGSISARQLTTAISQQLEEQRKQLLVLATLRESADDQLSEEDRKQAETNVANIVNSITQLGQVSHDVIRPLYRELRHDSFELLRAWEEFYHNYNQQHWQSPHPAPDLPSQYDSVRRQLREMVTRQGFIASQQAAIIDRTIKLTDRITVISFIASICLSSILGFSLIRYTNVALGRLKTGTLRFGSGDLNYRILNFESGGELGALATAFNNMSDKLRNALAEARQATQTADQASQAKSNFLANVSHELRTPLNAIIGYSEMLHDELDESAHIDHSQFQGDLEKILLSGKQLLAFIDDILDLSRIETGKMTIHIEEFDAANLLQQICESVKPVLDRNKNKLELDTDAGLLLHSDATRFRQIFVNLLSNASKFTQAGLIRVSASSLPGPEPRLLFTVSDTGIGMSAEQQSHIFEAFVQADSSTNKNYGGSGLGLTICKECCELMGGTITVASEPGGGSTFEVNLPVRAHAPEQELATVL